MSGLEAFVLGYVVNSLWQVPLVCLAGYVCARLMRRMGPQAEHWVWVTTLMIAAILPACAGAVVGIPHLFGGKGGGAGMTAVQVEMGRFTQVGGNSLHLPLWLRHGAVIVYLGLMLFFCARLVWGLVQSDRMGRGAQRLALTGDWQTVWERYCLVFDVRGAQIASTPMATGPLTVGFRRRMLLVSPGFWETAETEDTKAALAHELAHMHRQDFLKNVLYELASLPVSYHPMTRWLKGQIRQSRELVCDSMAAELMATREHYARSLLRLASLMSSRTPTVNIHAIGIFDANILERRVMNLMTKPRETTWLVRMGLAIACVWVGTVTCNSALALRLDVNEPPPATPATETTPAPKGPVRIASGVEAGAKIGGENPRYPADARKAHVEGTVVLRAVISKTGAVTNLQVTSGPEELRQSAINAVRTWQYKPFLLNGEPTAVETTINVTYSMGG